MNPRELILLSPYRLPAQNSLSVSDDDAAAFLNGHAALWHPALLWNADAAPKIASSYDYEQPSAGHVYAVPDSPPLMLPDDWEQRVADAGAVFFRVTADRAATEANLREMLEKMDATEADEERKNRRAALRNLTPEQVAPFRGIGLGFMIVNSLFEAMEHENLLAAADLWQDVQQAVTALGDSDDVVRGHLQAAADRLLNGREILYPSPLYIVDIASLDENNLAAPLPGAFAKEQPLNLLTSVATLEKLAQEKPELLATFRQRVQDDKLELCTGSAVERADALLPIESQLWNLQHGTAKYQELLQSELRVFGRQRFAAHPQLPLYLNTFGVGKAALLALDNGVLPSWRACVISWPSPDGKQVETFCRTPYAADSPQTGFHLAHYLHKTIRQDMAATFALLHKDKPAAPWYDEWLELARFGNALGHWTALGRYFSDAQASEYTSAASADEFHSDYLEERTNARSAEPVGWFARHARLRRKLDTAWTLAAIYRGLAGKGDTTPAAGQLAAIENKLEATSSADAERELNDVQEQITAALAGRLLSRAKEERPGYLVLNPCSYTRRVGLELADIKTPLPIEGPVKACQIDADKARLVVEVPPMGFAWFPKMGPAGTPPMKEKMKLADQRGVRNEFFDAEIDPKTGGLQALRDHKLRINRMGQILVFNPGSKMRADEVKVTVAGPALGEVVTTGTIRGEQEQVLARFTQRFRAWLGRPVLEMRLEITPEQPPAGYPWHAYFGARFAWGDDRTTLLRGVNGMGYVTTHTRPETPDFLEWRLGGQKTALFTGGLPFHQRHGARMLDVILIPEGEKTTTFEFALGIEREHLAHTAQGMVTPVPIIATKNGPPHVGASGWLFHLDAANLLLSHMKPLPDGADGVTARFLEVANHLSAADFRCARDPKQALMVDGKGATILETTLNGDAVALETAACDLVQVKVVFSE